MQTQLAALLVIFGGSGDLAKRKLYPAIFKLYQKGYLQNHFAVIGTARRPWTNTYYREVIIDSIKAIKAPLAQKQAFSEHFYYQSHDVTDAQHYQTLKTLANQLDEKYQLQQNRIFYMSMAPDFFGIIANHLRTEQLLTKQGFNRLIIEKPFGHDYQSAKALNDVLAKTFAEDQIYRIDHYLGKEMIQNIMALRFSNPWLESIWNRQYIDNIQITLAESVGVEQRAGYYDTSGALKDMFQNHIMQIMALLAMDKPKSLDSQVIQETKAAFFDQLQPLSAKAVASDFVRGQYLANNDQLGYRQEANVDRQSMTETFIAGKVLVPTKRFEGVPFYVRTGKRLAKKQTQIDIVLKNETELFNQKSVHNSVLSIQVEPNFKLELTLNGKKVGQGLSLMPYTLTNQYTDELQEQAPEAYERLILEAMQGDCTNFTRWHDLEKSWQYVDAIVSAWQHSDQTLNNYESGSMGPQAAFDLLGDCKWQLQ